MQQIKYNQCWPAGSQLSSHNKVAIINIWLMIICKTLPFWIKWLKYCTWIKYSMEQRRWRTVLDFGSCCFRNTHTMMNPNEIFETRSGYTEHYLEKGSLFCCHFSSSSKSRNSVHKKRKGSIIATSSFITSFILFSNSWYIFIDEQL